LLEWRGTQGAGKKVRMPSMAPSFDEEYAKTGGLGQQVPTVKLNRMTKIQMRRMYKLVCPDAIY
jgi:hypothetical protein